MTASNHSFTLAPTGLLLFLCSALIGCQATDEQTVSASAPLRPVKVLEASVGSGATQRVLASTVISADSQDLSFRIGGAITSLPINVGDRLPVDALVATLDQQPYKLTEKEARAQLAQSEANYRNAESQYQRTRELYSTEAATLSELENAKASAASAKASRAVAQEGLNSALLNLGYSELLNPSDNCQVVSVPVAINQNVSAGQTIATTACGNQLRLRTVVPESLINSIAMGASVTAKLQSGDVDLNGKVVEIAVSNTNSSGYAVEVELQAPPASVKVGMAASITFDIKNESERLVVPLIAVMGDNDEKFVFVATAEDDHYVIQRHAVQTGELGNDGIEVTAGIELGQQIVVAGMSRISEGMKVTLYTGIGQ